MTINVNDATRNRPLNDGASMDEKENLFQANAKQIWKL